MRNAGAKYHVSLSNTSSLFHILYWEKRDIPQVVMLVKLLIVFSWLSAHYTYDTEVALVIWYLNHKNSLNFV